MTRTGAGGAPTISAPGTTQALARSEPVRVVLDGRTGTVLRTNLVAALVTKAAARTEVVADRARARHCDDFVVLASLISARDFRDTELTRKDRTRLRRMPSLNVSGGVDALYRLERAARLTT